MSFLCVKPAKDIQEVHSPGKVQANFMGCLPNSTTPYKFPTAFLPDTVGAFSFPNVATKGSHRSCVQNKITCFTSMVLKSNNISAETKIKTVSRRSSIFYQKEIETFHTKPGYKLLPQHGKYQYFVTH